MNSLPPDVEVVIRNAFNGQGSPEGWESLASVGSRLRILDSSFSPQKYGFSKFVDFLKELPHLVELRRDDKSFPPVYYGRLVIGSVGKAASTSRGARVTPRLQIHPSYDVPFWKYAYIPTRNDTLQELAEKALKEN